MTKENRAMWTRVRSVVLATAMTLLGPALGTSGATHRSGDDSGPDAVLYELTEHAVITDAGLRIATSSLEGSARRGSALCPQGLQAYAKAVYKAAGVHVRIDPRCAAVAIGQSQIDLTTVPPAARSVGTSGSSSTATPPTSPTLRSSSS